jgi:GT2 family glycosyltransferase
MIEIIVSDDDSQDSCHIDFLNSLKRQHSNINIIFGNENLGFAGNVNRGLRHCSDNDVILINSDIETTTEGWLEILQQAVYCKDAAIGGIRLMYPSGDIQFGGGMRATKDSLWFDHLYRYRSREFAPAFPDVYTVYATGALMYIRNSAVAELGGFDPQFPMAFEDVDFCLRAWKQGLRTIYAGTATAIHHESVTRGRNTGEREAKSQKYFWEKHRKFFEREVRHPETNEPCVIFVHRNRDTRLGNRFLYSLAQYLAANGFRIQLWTVAESRNDSRIRNGIQSRAFVSYHELIRALSNERAIKVATCGETAETVWLAGVLTGIPAYLVQNIESDLHNGLAGPIGAKALSSYRPEFNYATTTEAIKTELEVTFAVHAICVGVSHQRMWSFLSAIVARPEYGIPIRERDLALNDDPR